MKRATEIIAVLAENGVGQPERFGNGRVVGLSKADEEGLVVAEINGVPLPLVRLYGGGAGLRTLGQAMARQSERRLEVVREHVEWIDP